MKKLRQDMGYGVDTKAKLYTSTTKTENKRFTLEEFGLIHIIVDDNGKNLTARETVDLLNEFNDENQRITSLLQSERRELIEQNNNYRKLLNELAEENIELHIQNDFLKDENQHMRDLVNENRQLKKENKEFKTTNAELEDYTARIEEELMNIRTENTKNKLILKDVVEDLEKQSNSNEPIIIRKDYIAWIKKNANLKFIRGKKK